MSDIEGSKFYEALHRAMDKSFMQPSDDTLEDMVQEYGVEPEEWKLASGIFRMSVGAGIAEPDTVMFAMFELGYQMALIREEEFRGTESSD